MATTSTSATEISKGVYKTTDAKGKVTYTQTPPTQVVEQDVKKDNNAAKDVAISFLDNKCKGVVYSNPVTAEQAKSCIGTTQKISKIPGYIEAYDTAQLAKARLAPGAGNGVASAVSAYGKASKILETPSTVPITGNILNNTERTKTALEATKAAEKGQAVINAAGKAPTAAVGAAAGRVAGVGLGVAIAALDPQVFSSGAITKMRLAMDKLWANGTIDDATDEKMRNSLSSNPSEVNQMIKNVQK